MVTQSKPCRIGVMGGTFDPIHYGHLVTAEVVRGEFDIDLVLFVPSGVPPHKDPRQVSSKEHRYLMTVFATLTNPFFEVSRVDIDREGETYTIDTLRDLRKLYGDEAELFFITGADAIAEIMDWKNAAELVKLAGLSRYPAGYQFDRKLQEWFEQHGKSCIAAGSGNGDFVDGYPQACAGTKSIRYFVPEAVEHYIRKNSLYLEHHTHSTADNNEISS